ncbi:MAG: hypothetical protein ACLFU4_04195 [Opitutales bacterium]
MPGATPVYLIFGIPDSGRREILFDLIEGGLLEKEQVLYFRPGAEPPVDFDARIETLENVVRVDWELAGGKVKHGPITAAPEKIFFLAPGTADPADVAEALKSWIDHNDCELARIITVVHCSFLAKNESSRAWFDACIHFSDVVLLARREGVDAPWLKDFQARQRKTCSPTLVELVARGKAKNPVAVLEPQARRLSLYFDELIPIEDDAFEDDEQPEDLKPDRYIERNESGQRCYPIPDIRKLFSDQ